MLAVTYATDEDLVIRAPGDFPVLVPEGQKLAAGTDGAFSPSDRWTLTSASTDFGTAGITAGCVCQLAYTTSRGVFGAEGEMMAVEAAVGHALTLRRVGTLAGQGLPPGPVTGLNGVTFAVLTLRGQIESASWDLNSRMGIDDLVSGRGTADLYDLRELREATVLMVLYDLYIALSRFSAETSGGGAVDVFGTKAKRYGTRLDQLLARLTLHWAARGQDPTVENSPFGARIER